MSKKQIQFELWQDCNSHCDFCYLNWFSVDRSDEHKLKRIHEVMNVLNDDSLYEEYDTVSLIGGEFFQGQLSNPEVRNAFFELIQKIRSLLDEGKIAQTWIMVSLLIGKQPDLYHALEILRNDPRVWFNTSWDISGRFKSEKMHRTWASHMLEIHRLYPRVNLNTTMILTQDLVKAYILGRFSFRDFCERYHTHLFLKPPAYNDLTEEIYCQRHPELANSSFDLPHNKLMFAELINNLNFFPKRSDFLSFLMKFKQDMGEVAYRDLFNIERRADDLYVTKSDGHTIKKCHREKQGNGFGDRENSLSTCGHSTYYAVYGDSDACMLCDKEYIGSL